VWEVTCTYLRFFKINFIFSFTALLSLRKLNRQAQETFHANVTIVTNPGSFTQQSIKNSTALVNKPDRVA
jgi:hypothetical protein